jgi:hypothetical protein
MNPSLLVTHTLNRIVTMIPDDELYIKLMWKLSRLNYPLNLSNPQTFNEKLQWLKLHDRNPKYTIMVDKIRVKEWVASKIGEQHIIPTLGVWESPEDIDFDSLPNQFVLKCNHNSGIGVYVCKDKRLMNKKKVIKDLKKGLQQNYYKEGREWPYKNVKPMVLAEKYMEDESGFELKDYKVFNFNGEPKIIEIDYDRFKGHKRHLYDVDWNKIDATIEFPSDPDRSFEKPKVLDQLLSLARTLSEGIPHVRTDFYIVRDRIYFGEMTFFHGSGLEHITPLDFDKQMGSWLILPALT